MSKKGKKNRTRLDFKTLYEVSVDCPESGPGPLGPGSGLDRTGRSEGPGQSIVGPTLFGEVQGQLAHGPDRGVALGSDLDRPY